MSPQYFSDSYDFVKRTLLSVRPGNRQFLGVPMFTARDQEIEEKYKTLLSLVLRPHLCDPPATNQRHEWIDRIRIEAEQGSYHLFLDPDTGIRIAGRVTGNRRKFVDTEEIRLLLHDRPDTLLVCFDQSLCRGSETEDCNEKLLDLRNRSIFALYFRSHASFLIAASTQNTLDEWLHGIQALGVPQSRLQQLA